MTLFPADRVAPLIRSFLDGFDDQRDRHGIGGYTALGELAAGVGSGVSVKTLKRIVNGHQRGVSFDKVEAILLALDAEYLLHVPAELGGFADIYEAADDLGLDDAPRLVALDDDEPTQLQLALFSPDRAEATEAAA